MLYHVILHIHRHCGTRPFLHSVLTEPTDAGILENAAQRLLDLTPVERRQYIKVAA